MQTTQGVQETLCMPHRGASPESQICRGGGTSLGMVVGGSHKMWVGPTSGYPSGVTTGYPNATGWRGGLQKEPT